MQGEKNNNNDNDLETVDNLSSLSRISTHLLSPSKSFGGTKQGGANVALGEGINVIINGGNILKDCMLVKRKNTRIRCRRKHTRSHSGLTAVTVRM